MKRARSRRVDEHPTAPRVHPVLGALPRNPTKGALFVMLDRLGVFARGKGYSETKLRALLEEHGVTFDGEATETDERGGHDR